MLTNITNVAGQIGALLAKTTEVEDFPSDHEVNGQAILQAMHCLKIAFLDAAAGL